MRMLTDFRVLSLLLILSVGFAFEGLRRFEISAPVVRNADLAKASTVFASNRGNVVPLEKPIRRPKAATPKMANPSGVKFDLASAISSYQKEHGLQETDTGAKKRLDKLKPDSSKDAKKKKADKYEYAYDYQRGRWVKRLKMSDEQRLEYQAKKRMEQMKKLQEQQRKLAEMNEDSLSGSGGGSGSTYVTGPYFSQQQQVPQDVATEDEEQKTCIEWTRIFEAQPTKVSLIAFTQAHEHGAVSSEVYGCVTESLASNPLPELKKYSIEIADQFPSVQSFRLLVKIMDQGQSEIYGKAEKLMYSDYGSMGGLNLLSKVMKLNDEKALIASVRTLDYAIKTLLKPGAQASVAQNFEKFKSLLEDMKDFGGAVSSRATTTLAQLQSSLGNQTVAGIN